MEKEEMIREIADTYGYGAQSRQLIEEMAELTQAINKLWRKRRKGNGAEIEKARENLAEELADVQIMIDQIRYLLKAEETVEAIITQKLYRQIRKIEEEEAEIFG